MKRLAFLLCLLSTPAQAPALVQDFLSRLPEVPLMRGLAERAEAGFLFDKPEGRIAESLATGAVEPRDVTSFYHATLAELGWNPAAGRLAFAREGERLTIAIERAGSGVAVRFTITPDRR
jgi:hypothetical protein